MCFARLFFCSDSTTLRPAAFPISAGLHFTEFREPFPSFGMFTPDGNARITVFIQCMPARQAVNGFTKEAL